MHLFPLALLALSSLRSVCAAAAADKAAIIDEEADPIQTPKLAVNISASFPSSEIFGIKLVNGRPTDCVLDFRNNEPGPLVFQAVSGQLWSPDYGESSPPQLVHNITTSVFRTEVLGGERGSFTFKFVLNRHPADFILRLVALVTDDAGNAYTLPAFEGDVAVVEAPQSFFDPKIWFLYIILGGGFAGTAYFVYSTWITTLFPQQKRRGGKGGDRARTSSKGTRRVDAADQVSVAGADGPAVTSGAKAYDESWIPAQHLKRPEAKRIRSGTPTGVKTKKTVA